jgi:Mg-chelatase subunit ChlD
MLSVQSCPNRARLVETAQMPRPVANHSPVFRSRLRMLAVLSLGLAVGCESPRQSRQARADTESAAPYQAEVEEGLGAAVAILIDTSGSMKDNAPGEARPKYVVAREALEAMLDATDAVVAKRPGFPVKVGIFSFSSSAQTLLPVQLYERGRVRAALDRLPMPGGGTAIGEAMRTARPELYRAGVFRKYLLVVTDGQNTSGRSPDDVARDVWRKSEGGVQIHFVAFDTSPEKFAFLTDVGGSVMAAANGGALRTALDEIYQGKILAEAVGAGEREIRK